MPNLIRTLVKIISLSSSCCCCYYYYYYYYYYHYYYYYYYYYEIFPSSFLGIFSHVSAAILQLRDKELSLRYEQHQGWLTTAHFQKRLADSTSHARPLHSSREFLVHQSQRVLLTLMALWILLISRARS